MRFWACSTMYTDLRINRDECIMIGCGLQEVKKLSCYFADYWQAGNSFIGVVAGTSYSGTPLKRTPLGPKLLSAVARFP